MVDKLRQLLAEVEKKRGKVTLFSILKMDEFTDKWTVLLAASWVNETNRNEIFNEIVAFMKGVLTPEEQSSIARIGIFTADDHSIQPFLQYQTNTYIKEDTKINGYMVHEAHIIETNPSI